MSGTLVKRAEGLLASLGDEAHEVARQVFLRLVTFNEGGEDTRRRVLRSELEDLDVDRLVLRSVLDTFGRHRLLSFDRDPITQEPDGRDLTRGVAHRVDPAARLDRRGATRRPRPTPARGSDARMDRRPTAPTRTSCEAVCSNRCTAGSPPPRCSCPPPSRPSSAPASPNATGRRRSFSNASTGRSRPNAASGSAAVNSSSSVS